MLPTASDNRLTGGDERTTLAAPVSSGSPIPGASDPAAIQTLRLRKVYGRRHVAVEDLSLEVRAGEVFGFLGPNGAGKTTTVKMLLGLVRPTTGEARLFGQPATDPASRRMVGYLPENFRFHDWLGGAALLDFHARLAGMAASERRARIPEVLQLVGLEGRGGDRVRDYSKGMTQRLGLAQALLHRPGLVLLDEPTSALDPIGRREIRDVIRSLRAEGVTVFLNSHLLSEVEMVCDRVAIVDHGRVVRSGPLSELVAGAPEVRLTLDRLDARLLETLRPLGEVLAADYATATLTMGVASLESTPLLAEEVIRAGYRLYGLVPAQRSLEDVFVKLVDGHDNQRVSQS